MPVPRVDLRARRPAARGAALGPRARVRRRRARARADPGRHVGAARLRESRTRTQPPLADALGDVPAQLAEILDVDALEFRFRAEFELEANWKIVVRELPRVLPLRRRAPGVQRRRRRLTGRVPARVERPASRASSARCARTATRSSPAARCRAASSTSSGRTSASTSSRAPEPLVRADAPGRARANGAVPRLLLRTGRRPGLDRRAAGVRRPGRQRGPGPRGGRPARRSLGLLPEGRILSESEQLVAHFQRLCAEALTG